MSRKRRADPKVTVAKKKPPRWQRERHISRILGIILPLVIALIVVLVGYWAYDSYVRVWNTPVAKVNGTTLDMDYFVKMVRFFRATTGTAVDPWQVSRALAENELIRQEAARLGITVSEEEVTEMIAATFPAEPSGDIEIVDPGALPPGNTTTPAAGNESSTTTGNATPDISIIDPGSSADGDSQAPAAEIGESYQRWLEQIRLSDAEYRRVVETALLGDRLKDYFAQEEVPDEVEHVHLHLIPLDTEAAANEVLDRLRGGEDFAVLANQFSVIDDIGEANGDVGWVPRGIFPEMDDVAFNLGIGNVSDLVATSQGYYILKVTGYAESMPVVDEYRTELGRSKFESWLREQMETNVEEYLDQSAAQWALDHIG